MASGVSCPGPQSALRTPRAAVRTLRRRSLKHTDIKPYRGDIDTHSHRPLSDSVSLSLSALRARHFDFEQEEDLSATRGRSLARDQLGWLAVTIPKPKAKHLLQQLSGGLWQRPRLDA